MRSEAELSEQDSEFEIMLNPLQVEQKLEKDGPLSEAIGVEFGNRQHAWAFPLPLENIRNTISPHL